MLSGRKKILLLFLLQLLLTFELNTFFPNLKVCFFIPFLAYLTYELPFIKLLWIALLSGLSFDAMSTQYILGAHAFSFTLSAAICYRLKKFFFKDRKLTLLMVASALSFSNALILTVLFSPFEQRLFSGLSLFSDYIVYPVVEGVTAFILYTLPVSLLSYFKVIKKSGNKDHFSRKRPQ